MTGDHGFSAPGVADALPYEVQSPDEFFVLVDDATPATVREVAVLQAAFYLDRRGGADLGGALRASGCPRFGERVDRHVRAVAR